MKTAIRKKRETITKRKFCVLLILCLCASLVLSACNKLPSIGPSNETDEYATYKYNNTEVKPKNVIKMGESFEVELSLGTGHFLCTVTGARVLTDESQLTLDSPDQLLEDGKLIAIVDGEGITFPYEEWFTEGGAFDHGCRLILIDMSVTNVDAEAWLDSGDPRGFFEDPYAFYAHDFISVANLSRYTEVAGQYDFGNENYFYFDKTGDYCPEDILPTMGIEPYAIQILPGQTVTYTLGYGIPTDKEGNPYKLSNLMAVVRANANAETGIFIDLELEAE